MSITNIFSFLHVNICLAYVNIFLRDNFKQKIPTVPFGFEPITIKEVEIAFIVKKALIDNKIDTTTKRGSAYWSNNGGYICKIPSDKKPQNYLVEFAMYPQDESKAFLEQLKKLM